MTAPSRPTTPGAPLPWTHRGASYICVQIVTLSRIPIAAVFLVLLWQAPGTTSIASHWLARIAISLLVLIELSDFVDGLIARRLSLQSELGAMLDPWADSLSRILVYWALARADLCLSWVPLVMAMRDVTVSYARVILARRGRSVAANFSGKAKAVVQSVAAFVCLAFPALRAEAPTELLVALSWIVAVVTALSAVQYIAAALAPDKPCDAYQNPIRPTPPSEPSASR